MYKIGLVTFWNNNYGSVLQCYATKQYLKNKGYDVVLLNEKNIGTFRHIENILNKMKKILKLSMHPKYLKKNIEIRNGYLSNKYVLSIDSKKKIEAFAQEMLQPQDYSYNELKKMARLDEYKYFITGSDQVWNFSNGIISNFYMLNFCPNNKKIALSPSLGTDYIPSFLNRKLKKNFRTFKNISVREEKGKEYIKKLSGMNATVLPDPVFLLNKDEWINFSLKGMNLDREYIFIHFIGKPMKSAVESIKKISNSENVIPVIFAYKHKELTDINNAIYIEGSPYDYVSLINNARYIYTDSFHTTIFSLKLEKNFIVCKRDYGGKADQSSRIINILNKFNCIERYIKNDDCEIDWKRYKIRTINLEIKDEQKKVITYLDEAIEYNKGKCEKIREKERCYQCNLCTNVCPKKAIEPQKVEFGNMYPKINKESCIGCNICTKICNFKVEKAPINQEFYVGYAISDKIRDNAASGGIFSAIAEDFIKNGGNVFGAELTFKDGIPYVEHTKIDKIEDLYRIQDSKYVRSDCKKAYIEINRLIKDNKKVLFCGTPCQIYSLYRSIGRDYLNNNLYTIDLICHGTPSLNLYRDYINMLNKKYKGKVIAHKFRTKKNGIIIYEEQVYVKNKKNEEIKINIPLLKSAYMKMFMDGESYSEACYNCEFSLSNRKADITLGDYFELKYDNQKIYNKMKDKEINCIIVNNEKGKELIERSKEKIIKEEIDSIDVMLSHPQLCKPMRYTMLRNKLIKIYQKYGYEGIDNYYKRDYAFKYIFRKLYCNIKTKK